jgi:predicted ribosomally synthesized peptide with SipW-like signal peptide
MKNKRNIITTFIIILIIIIAVGGVFAYLTSTDTKTNVFTVGRVKIELTEPNFVPASAQYIRPGDEVNKNPQIKNIGTNSAYVYIKVEEPLVELSNNTVGPLFSYDTNTGWTLLGTNNGQDCENKVSVYYYNTALAKNETTATLFDNVTINDFSNSNPADNNDMVITGYAIQSSYLPNGTTIQSAYETYFYNSGLNDCTLPIIKPTSENDTTAFRSETYKSNIRTIILDNHINPPADVVDSWDIGVNQNGDVMAYLTQNEDDNTIYDLYIQGRNSLYANPDSSYLFAGINVDYIDGIDKLNTSKVTNMSHMFYLTGASANNTSFTLNLGNNFDTSKVTNMSNMFNGTGMHSYVFTLDLGDKFDTSKVTDMSSMFAVTGYFNQSFTLDLGNKFDTSEVTNMSNMFSSTGYKSSMFTLDLGNKFNTSKVTNMEGMFDDIARYTNNLTLDLSLFDFSNVTSYENIFYRMKTTSTIYVGNSTARSWIINNSGNSNLTTSNVLIKS